MFDPSLIFVDKSSPTHIVLKKWQIFPMLQYILNINFFGMAWLYFPVSLKNDAKVGYTQRWKQVYPFRIIALHYYIHPCLWTTIENYLDCAWRFPQYTFFCMISNSVSGSKNMKELDWNTLIYSYAQFSILTSINH